MSKQPKQVFQKGPPPHVQWWCTSISISYSTWRWWNGKSWSLPAFSYNSALGAEIEARNYTALAPHEIEWCDYWPEKARVPRIDPRQ
jgi:hypothetical protein